MYCNLQFLEDRNSLIFCNIYTYDLKTKRGNIYGGQSKVSKNQALKFNNNSQDPDRWSIHAIESPHFFPVLRDPARKLYYRPYWADLPYQVSDNYFNRFEDKELYLTILDDNFKIIKDIKLPDKTYPIFLWFVSEEGFYICPCHPESKDVVENVLIFHVYKFSLNAK